MATERRETGRVRIDRRATVRLSRGLRTIVRVVDLSIQGMGILCEARGEKGAVLEVEVGLPHRGSVIPVKLHGQVCHSHLQGNEFYTWLSFVNLSDKDRCTLERFLHLKTRQRVAMI
jgi:hypothetical protein